MDSQAFLALAILVAIFILMLLVVIFFAFYSRKPVLPGPPLWEYLPGGTVFPIFQNSRNVGDVLSKMRETYGETFSIWYGPVRVVVTSVPQDVAHVLGSTKEFRRGDDVRTVFNTFAPGGTFTMVGEPHRSARKSMREQFSHAMLQSFHDKMTDATNELCDSLLEVAGKGPVDMIKLFAVTSFRVIINVAYGAGMEKTGRMKFNAATDTLAEEMIKEIIGYPIRQKLSILGIRNKYMNCIQTIRSTCRSFIEKRLAETDAEKKSRKPDILDTMLEISRGDLDLTMAFVIDFATAGTHTTNQILTWTVYEMYCNPGVLAKLYRELDTVVGHKPTSEPLTLEDLRKLKFVMQVWKEVLRRRPITNLLMRVTTQDVELKGSGITLPKGTMVSAFYGHCHVDPQIWKDPLEFRPERWESEGHRVPPGAYVPFGAGELSCAGRFLADYEGPLIIAEIYRRFKFELACRPEEVKRRSQFIDTPQYVRGEVEGGVPIEVHLR